MCCLAEHYWSVRTPTKKRNKNTCDLELCLYLYLAQCTLANRQSLAILSVHALQVQVGLGQRVRTYVVKLLPKVSQRIKNNTYNKSNSLRIQNISFMDRGSVNRRMQRRKKEHSNLPSHVAIERLLLTQLSLANYKAHKYVQHKTKLHWARQERYRPN